MQNYEFFLNSIFIFTSNICFSSVVVKIRENALIWEWFETHNI